MRYSSTPYGARIDAEDIGQTNPCPIDDTFFDLLRRNVAGLVENFWAAGYVNVIAGSFLRRYSDYVSLRQLLRPSAVFLVDPDCPIFRNLVDHVPPFLRGPLRPGDPPMIAARQGACPLPA